MAADNDFEIALNELVDLYSHEPYDVLISALEIKLAALKEQYEQDGGQQNDSD